MLNRFRRNAKYVSDDSDDSDESDRMRRPGPYSPMDPNTDICLIKIMPATPREGISITLQSIALDSKPRFTFIGHNWDSSELRQIIICNGQPLSTTRRIMKILESLRNDDVYSTHFFWLDAICIDQENLGEKAGQIRLLATICLSSELTLSWTNIDVSYSTFKFLEEVAAITDTLSHARPQDEFLGLLQSNHTIIAENFDAYELHYQAVVAALRNGMRAGFDEHEVFAEICALCNSEYFNRRWILSGFVLPRRMVLRCGSIDIPWDILSTALQRMVMYGAHAELKSPQIENILVADLLRKRYRHFRLSFVEALPATQSCNFRTTYEWDDLDALYRLTNHRFDIVRLPQVDISSDASGTSRSLCELISEFLEGPTFLALTGAPQDGRLYAMPLHQSWIPDFRALKQRLLLAHPNSNFSASQGTFKFLADEEGRLTIAGAMVDTIASVAGYLAPRRICDQYDIAGDNVFEFIRWHQFARATEQSILPYGSDELLTRFAETIQARGCNHIWEDRENRSQSHVAEQVRSFLHFLRDPDLPETTAVRMFYAACLPSHDRRFGLTQTGRFCLLPLETAPGDLVCIVKGFKVPVVLRNDGNHYKNIGESYIHGIMNGQVDDAINTSVIIT